MDGKQIHIHISLSRRDIRLGLALAVLVGLAHALRSDTVKLSTYYPAPSGVYRRFITTRQTLLARDGDKVGIGTSTPAQKLDVVGSAAISGKLGIGTANPQSTLDVNGQANVSGTLRIGTLPSDPPGGKDGMLYFNTTTREFKGYWNGAWQSLGGGAMGACKVFSASGSPSIWNSASVSVAPGYTLIGGGCGGLYYNAVTQSYPSGQSWQCTGKANWTPANETQTAYAIGCK